MLEINKYVKEGATQFLKQEYMYLAIFCTFFSVLLFLAVDMHWDGDDDHISFPYTTVAFIVGASTSMLAGYIGMKIATETNVKVTYLCNTSIEDGFIAAFQGGQVLGFCLVGLALLILEVLILSYKGAFLVDSYNQADAQKLCRELFEVVSGYGLGGSTVALFGRVGGGIYTKAADVGADLAGKVNAGIPEDSPLNPGTIADNVGDNVGDIAGMGADLFGSLAEATCAALVVSASSWPILETVDAVYFPMLVTSVGIVASFITQFFVHIKSENVENKLKVQLIVSTILMTIFIIPITFLLPENLQMDFAGNAYDCT